MKTALVEVGELVRFILTGVTATLGNMVAVWLARSYWAFEAALLAGIAAGITVSFVLSKWFAFGSRSWGGAPGEMARFLVVYAVSCALYWVIAVAAERLGRACGLSVLAAEALGILIGAGTMAVTSYLGHRFFTYRTYQRHAGSFGAAP
jgi:putative flippase GtrA